jgi:hypothetical protein
MLRWSYSRSLATWEQSTGIDQRPVCTSCLCNVLSGVLAPVLVVYLLVIGNNRTIMRNQRLGLMTNIGPVVTALLMFTAAILLFYGLATGQGGWNLAFLSGDAGIPWGKLIEPVQQIGRTVFSLQL